jgi:hypothetical protein
MGRCGLQATEITRQRTPRKTVQNKYAMWWQEEVRMIIPANNCFIRQ